MRKTTNPFRSENPYVRDTFLLNYGEENLSMYHQLTRNSCNSVSRQNIIAEATILTRKRKELFQAEKGMAESEKQEHKKHKLIKQRKDKESFWNTVSKGKNLKTIRNPFVGQYISAPFGYSQKKKEEAVKKDYGSIQVSKKKEIIRHQVGALKTQIRQIKSVSLRKGLKNQFSVTNLYKAKRKVLDKKDFSESILDDENSLTQASTPINIRKIPPKCPKPFRK